MITRLVCLLWLELTTFFFVCVCMSGNFRDIYICTHAHPNIVVKSHPSQNTEREAGCSYGNLERREMIGQRPGFVKRYCKKPGVRLSHPFPCGVFVLLCVAKEFPSLIRLVLCRHVSCPVWGLCLLSGWCDRVQCVQVCKPWERIASFGCALWLA